MQQRQLRLGDILDDYCPRERRVTNRAVVAMLGPEVKQTRCTTCDAEHEYKQAKVPRQRRKNETPAALYAQVAANAPKRVAHAETSAPGDAAVEAGHSESEDMTEPESPVAEEPIVEPSGGVAEVLAAEETDENDDEREDSQEEGPVHRPLIRASLPRPEGQQPPARPIPEFTIRQPTGRQNRFRPRGPRGQQQGGGNGFQGGGANRGNGNFGGGPPRGARPGGGRPQHGGGGPMTAHLSRRPGPGRKRAK